MKRNENENETAEPVSRSGRFQRGPHAEVSKYTQSVSYDWRLWRQDIMGSIAHATMLSRIGVLTENELQSIQAGLEHIGQEIEEGRFEWSEELEDVHMNIEAALTQRAPAGAKLHTARSRNDQISLDLRMWLRDEMVELTGEIRGLQSALVRLAQDNSEIVIPGYTHLQRAQPVYFAHHLLAYVEMLERDYERQQDCFQRVNVCPLGNGALASTTLPIDREFTAKMLEFVDAHGKPRLTQNSMDGVSDRDFVVEFCAAAALMAVHLSRLAEDVVLWTSQEFSFLKLSDDFTTGSSLMPQKKNPDVAEITRGKTGRVVGNLVSVLTMLKGLPMTYNRDLQEDKERLFDTVDTARSSLRIMAGMFAEAEVNQISCALASSDPALLATDLADHLVLKGQPFRKAHHIVGRIVGLSEELEKPLNQLSLKELQSAWPELTEEALKVFDLKKALNYRNLPGGPGAKEVRKQLNSWRKKLEA